MTFNRQEATAAGTIRVFKNGDNDSEKESC